jgi:hypothetical protein
MEKFGDSYIMKPEAAGSNYFFKDEEEKNNVLFFFNPLSSTSIKAYNNLIDFSKDHPTDISIHYYSRQTAGADELREISRELCIRSYGHEKLVSYLSCMDGRFTEDNALKCLDASISKSKVEECIETDAQKLLDIDNELAKHYYINTLPVFIFNNQYKKGGSLSVDILEESYCKVNPGNCE